MPDEMTPERALIVLNQCNTDGRIKVDREELKQAVKMASEAIRYRIPRKKEPCDINGACCPVCGSQEIDYFCGECGQAIDWSDYE